MPTIFRKGPYRFHFYSKEPGEPPHVHVARDDFEAKFWLVPVSLSKNYGLAAHEIQKILGIIRTNEDILPGATNSEKEVSREGAKIRRKSGAFFSGTKSENMMPGSIFSLMLGKHFMKMSDIVATEATVKNGQVKLHLLDGSTHSFPVHFYPRLAQSTPEQLASVKLRVGGRALRWEEVDEDIWVADAVMGNYPATVSPVIA